MRKKFNKTSVSVFVGALFLPLLSVTALAQNVSVKDNIVTLPISFTKDVAKFNITQLTGTKKLVIDFYDVKDSLVKEPLANNPLISNINSKTFGDRLRVIVDVAEPVKYSLVKKGNDIVLQLEKSSNFQEVKMPTDNIVTSIKTQTVKTETKTETIVTPVVAVVPVMPVRPVPVIVQSVQSTVPVTTKAQVIQSTTSQPVALVVESKFNSVKDVKVVPVVSSPMQVMANKVTEIEHVSMKKDNANTKITFDLNNTNFNPVFKRDNNTLILDMKGVNIPTQFQKNIDTKSLGNILNNVDIGTQAGSARIVFQTNDNWDYSAYQLDKKFVIEFKAKSEKEDKAVFKGKTLSFNFQNMDIRGILQVIADFTNLNIMASDAVQGNLNLRLKDVPWDQALNLVLESKNLTQIREGNVVWIATAQEISDKNKSKLEIKNQLNELEPLKLQFFQLNHYNAKEMKAVLEGKSDSASGATDNKEASSKIFLSARGSIGLDVRNNTIFVQDTDERVKSIASIIKRLDGPVRQVLIEAKLVIATDNFQKQLGSKFGFALSKKNPSTNYGLGGSQSQSQQQTGFASNTANSTGNSAGNITFDNAWNSPVAGGGALGFTILNAIAGNALSLEISALEGKSLAKVISSPKLLTTDNKKAEIKQGTQIPYTIPGTSTTPAAVAFKDAFLKLGVTPQVSPNGRIVMDLDISKDDVGQFVSLPGGGSVPSIDTRQITTQVTVNDGQTVILGGIYEITSSNDLSKVPFFGDIPFLGNLFKNTNKQDKKVELVIMITPHVINDSDLDALDQGQAVTEIELKK